MNKDVIYIEPEDDITDIIAKLRQAKQKLVALVPPKKIGVLRSAVNTKLVAKAARQAEKVVVIVTTDASLIKLAAEAQIPVAKTLQSRPKLPSEIIREEKEIGEQIIDEKDFPDEESASENSDKSVANSAKATSVNKASASVNSESNEARSDGKVKKPDQEFNSEDLEKQANKKKKGKLAGKIPSLDKYRKWIIAGSVAAVALIVFIVWATIFAPSAKISVAIRTTANNFSENVSFVTDQNKADAEKGTFLLEQQKIEKKASVEFTATGSKDIGEKAKGTLTITAAVNSINGITIPAGTTFSYGSNSYSLDRDAKFTVDETDGAKCILQIATGGSCSMTADVPVTAVSSGEDYNIGAHDSGWTSSSASVTSAKNSAAFAGGSSKVVTVVQQSDIDKAKQELENSSEADGKKELTEAFGDSMVIIESSFETNISDPTSTPGKDEQVEDGKKAKLEITTTYTMYAVDKTALENYIKTNTESKLASDQKVYEINTSFFERFQKDGDNYTAKLKATTQTGPQVTEEDILEKSKGRRVGEVQSLLKSINGISTVSVKTSFFWVGSVPNDPNKITIELKVEE